MSEVRLAAGPHWRSAALEAATACSIGCAPNSPHGERPVERCPRLPSPPPTCAPTTPCQGLLRPPGSACTQEGCTGTGDRGTDSGGAAPSLQPPNISGTAASQQYSVRSQCTIPHRVLSARLCRRAAAPGQLRTHRLMSWTEGLLLHPRTSLLPAARPGAGRGSLHQPPHPTALTCLLD